MENENINANVTESIYEKIKLVIFCFLAITVGSIAFVNIALLIGIYDVYSVAYIGEAIIGSIAIWYFFIKERGYTLKDFDYVALAKPKWRLVLQIPLMIFAAGLLNICLSSIFSVPVGSQPVSFGKTSVGSRLLPVWIDWAVLILGSVLATTVIPFIEEIIFRKLLTDVFSKYLHISVVIILNSVIFAAVHLNSRTFIYLFFLGLFCNILYVYHKSLWAAFWLHAVNNGYVMIITTLLILVE